MQVSDYQAVVTSSFREGRFIIPNPAMYPLSIVCECVVWHRCPGDSAQTVSPRATGGWSQKTRLTRPFIALKNTDCGIIVYYSQYMASQFERRRDTRRRILSAASKLFKVHGFEGTSVDQIVAAANLAKGTFYQYFQTKIDVALALTSEEQQHLMEKMRTNLASGRSPLAVGSELLRSMATWFERNRGIARPLLLRALDQPRIESPDSTRAMLALIFTEAQKRGEIRADLPAEYISGLLVGSIVQIALHWTLHGKRGQLTEWFSLAWRLHLEGALPR